MKVGKMSIGEETRNRLNANPYNNAIKKTLIRREGVINLIKSKESGHLFSTLELINAAGYIGNWKSNKKEYDRGTSLVNQMIKSGIIQKIPEIGTQRNAYAVTGDVKVLRKKRSSNKNKIVNRKVEDLVKVDIKEVGVKSNGEEVTTNPCDDSNMLDIRSYNITFTIDKKTDAEYGKKSIAKLELNETTLEIAKEMILKTIEASE